MPRPKTRQQNKKTLTQGRSGALQHICYKAVCIHSFWGNPHKSNFKQLLTRINIEIKKWNLRQFSVKSLEYVEELQHPWRMKHCTQKTSRHFAQQGLKMFFSDALATKTQRAGAWSSHHKSTVLTPFIPQQGDRQCADLIPWFLLQARFWICSFPPSPFPRQLLHGSGDDLWLPGLAGHLGATLYDDRRTSRGLAIQAEAADHVLQSCAFGLPFLQRKNKMEKYQFISFS